MLTNQQSTHRHRFIRLFKTQQAEAKKKTEKMASKGVRGAEEKDGGCDDLASDGSESTSAMLRVHRSSSSSSSSSRSSVELKGMKGRTSVEKPYYVGGSEALKKKDGAAATVRRLLVHERVRACLRVCCVSARAQNLRMMNTPHLSLYFFSALRVSIHIGNEVRREEEEQRRRRRQLYLCSAHFSW